METIHFTVGQDFGLLLANLANEKIVCNYDLEEAFRVYKDSLDGIPNEYIKDLILGKTVIHTDVESQLCNIIERDDTLHSEYPQINFYDLIKKQSVNIIDNLKDMKRVLNTSRYGIESHDIEIKVSKIVKFISGDENFNDYMEEVFGEDLYHYQSIIRIYKDTVGKALNFLNLIKSAKSLGLVTEEVELLNNDVLFDIDEIKNNVWWYTIDLNRLYISWADDNIDENDEYKELENFILGTQEIENVIEKGIAPVDIMDNYDAGWLSPNGEFYGLRGEYANMLHITIAEQLKEINVIPNDYTGDLSQWLEKNGWAKIHHNVINYGGTNPYHNKKPVYLTPQQIKIIFKYGQVLYDGMLKVGYLINPMSTARFEMLAEAESEQLYDLF